MCDICQESPDRSYVLMLTDKNGKFEIAGCGKCIDKAFDSMQVLENKEKLSNVKQLQLVGLGRLCE